MQSEMAVEALGRDEDPPVLLQGKVEALECRRPRLSRLIGDEFLTTRGGVLGRSGVQNLLERDHLLSDKLANVAHMLMGALNGVQAQQQRHRTLAPSQSLLRIAAQLLVLRRLRQHCTPRPCPILNFNNPSHPILNPTLSIAVNFH